MGGVGGEGEGGEEGGFGCEDGGGGAFVGGEFVDEGEDGGDVCLVWVSGHKAGVWKGCQRSVGENGD